MIVLTSRDHHAVQISYSNILTSPYRILDILMTVHTMGSYWWGEGTKKNRGKIIKRLGKIIV